MIQDNLPAKTNENKQNPVDDGSYLIGILLGCFLNVLGLIVAIFIKQKKTKKALIITSLISFLMTIIIAILVVHTMIKIYGGFGQ